MMSSTTVRAAMKVKNESEQGPAAELCRFD
jgi:hypothetical protein